MFHVSFAYEICSDLVFTVRKMGLREWGGLVSSGLINLKSLS